MKNKSTWHPIYTITPATAAALMQIEADRIVVGTNTAAEAHIRRGGRGECRCADAG